MVETNAKKNGAIDLALGTGVFTTSVIDEAIQELDLLFSTNNGELIGDPGFGSDFEQFLWTLTPESTEVKKYVISLINNTFYAARMCKTDVNVDCYNGETSSIYIVSINLEYPSGLTENERKRTRVYKFS